MDASGVAHNLGVRVQRDPIRFVGDRIATVLTNDGKPPRTLALVGLNGHVQPIARMVNSDISDDRSLVGLDFDGQHLAWAEAQCETVTIQVIDPATNGFQPPVTGVCLTPILTSRSASVDRAGRFHVAVDCLPGCHGNLIAINPRHHSSADRVVARQRAFRLAPGFGPRRIALQLNANGRRLLRRFHSVGVRVRMTAKTDADHARRITQQTVVSLHR